MESKTHELLVVHGLDGGVSLGLLAKGDEAEAARATSSGLSHDNAVNHLAELGERIAERVVVGSPARSGTGSGLVGWLWGVRWSRARRHSPREVSAEHEQGKGTGQGTQPSVGMFRSLNTHGAWLVE